MHDNHVAVIGMAGRFPDAENLEAFWRNLLNGVESIVPLNEAALRALGVPPAASEARSFVKAGSILPAVDRFDAAFFGYTPAEAELLDPQHRLFLECAWEALEDAGHRPDVVGPTTGVFAATSLSTYLLFNLVGDRAGRDPREFEMMIGNDKDFLATRVAYKLDLRGPSIDVQTACSSSLVAVHLACQSLLLCEIDLALAGGVSVQVPQRSGYIRQDGLTSGDGHCRPFDQQASGTVFGSGAAVVALKRLADALKDRDTIHGVIRATAVNNDGARKVGFVAPSIDGQAEVIQRAHLLAEVDADTIGFVEAHGTGTPLGDAVEVAALVKAWRIRRKRERACALGSLKSNIGHLDAAAGVTGLIKAVLATKHGVIPPTVNYRTPNAGLGLDDTPFFVNDAPVPWPRPHARRRATVSSFGIGGTNAHVVIEEPPEMPREAASRAAQILPLSARHPAALDTLKKNLAAHLRAHPNIDISDVCYTLLTGRQRFEHRWVATCRSREDALTAFDRAVSQRSPTFHSTAQHRSVAYLFPGGGAQYLRMGAGLYAGEPEFKTHFDACAAAAAPKLGRNLCDLLYKDDATAEATRLSEPVSGLVALFAVEYALTRLWRSWDVEPVALLGHSLGEYAAASAAGVLSLDDALALVLLRGRLFETLPPGSMLVVGMSERDVQPWLQRQRLSVAAVNSPEQVVLSGPAPAIDATANALSAEGVDVHRLAIDVAAHSSMVDQVLTAFEAGVRRVRLEPPRLPVVSSLTGTWLEDRDATDPRYWVRQLRETVRFADGIATLAAAQNEPPVFLEAGPGRALTQLAQAQTLQPPADFICSLRPPSEAIDDAEFLAGQIGKLWSAGGVVNWQRYYQHERRRRVSLPTYPFQRARLWIDPPIERPSANVTSLPVKTPVAEWFYVPVWRSLSPLLESPAGAGSTRTWLVLGHGQEPSSVIADALQSAGDAAIAVWEGGAFERVAPWAFTVEAANADHCRAVATVVGDRVDAILDLRLVEGGERGADRLSSESHLVSLLRWTEALVAAGADRELQLWVVANQVYDVEQRDPVDPMLAMVPALGRVIRQEFEHVDCRTLCLGDRPLDWSEVARLVKAEACAQDVPADAVRGGRRWLRDYAPLRLPRPAVSKAGDVFLITGGTGLVGVNIAEALAASAPVSLILVSRSGMPTPGAWPSAIDPPSTNDAMKARLRRLQRLREQGSDVRMVAADVADAVAMRAVVDDILSRHGRITGVLHAAGLAGVDALKLLPEVSVDDLRAQMHAKVDGTRVLASVLDGVPVDFVILFSSMASVLGGIASGCYAAANAYLDAFASGRADGTRWISADWDGWPSNGEGGREYRSSIDQYAMTAEESAAALMTLVGSNVRGQVLVSTASLAARLATWIDGAREHDAEQAPKVFRERPSQVLPYEPAVTALERQLVQVWEEFLRVTPVGLDDSFFELGGNSLIAIRLARRLSALLNTDVAVARIFEGPTIRSFLAHMEHAAPTSMAAHAVNA